MHQDQQVNLFSKIIYEPGIPHISKKIFGLLNFKSLWNCRAVSKKWKEYFENYANENLDHKDILSKCPKEFTNLSNQGQLFLLWYAMNSPKWNINIDLDLFIILFAYGKIWEGRANDIFHNACKTGNADIVKAFIDIGQKQEIRLQMNWHQQTPLHVACQHGHLDVVKLLLKKEIGKLSWINMSIVNSDYQTPLHIACKHRHIDIVRVLLKHKIHRISDVVDIYGKTPMKYASENDSLEIVDLLNPPKSKIRLFLEIFLFYIFIVLFAIYLNGNDQS